MKKSYSPLFLAILGLLLLSSNALFAQTSADFCLTKGNKNSTWVNNLKIGIWNNQSGNNNGYQATAMDWPLQSGFSYTLQLEMGGAVRIQDTLYWRIWADLNGDKDFEDLDELLFQAKTMQRLPAKGVLNVPGSLLTGAYHFRIILSKKAFASSCGEGAEVQEVEDYQFNINGINPCSPLDTQNIQVRILGDSTAQFILHNPDSSAYFLEFYDGEQQLLQTYIFPQTDTILLPQLNAGSHYGVRVRLHCPPNEFSDWSPLVKFSMPVAICNTPLAQQFDLLLTEKNQLQFIADVPALRYLWRIRLEGDSTWTHTFHSLNDTLSLEVPYDDLFIDYQVAIECKNRAYSEWSETKTFKKSTCKLPHPILITAQYDVFYQTLEFNGGTPAQLYRWRLRTVGDSNWKEITTTEQELHLDTLLINNQEVQLQILCDDGAISNWSNSVQVTKVEPSCTRPEPDQFYMRSTGKNRYQFIATVPAQTYRWRFRVEGDTTWTEYLEWHNDTLEYLLPYDGLALELQLSLRCENQALSEWSSSKTFQTNVLSCDADLFNIWMDPSTGQFLLTSIAGGSLYRWRLRAVGDTSWKIITTHQIQILLDTAFYQDHEVQLQILCNNGKFSLWSPSKIIAKRECPQVRSGEIVHFDYFYAAYPTFSVRWISKKHGPTISARYRWSFREEGLEQWSTPINTKESTALLEGMTPGKTYEIRMEIICDQDSLNPISVIEVKKLPLSCVEIDESLIHLYIDTSGVITEVEFENGVPLQLRLGPKGSTQLDTFIGLGWWLRFFNDLEQDTEYEISVRGYCFDGTELPWSDPLYFKTLSCHLPKFGKIDIKEFAPLDSIVFEASFERPNPLDTASWQYHWQYRIRDSSQWTKTAVTKGNFPSFVVRNLTANTNYEIQLVTHCVQNPVDSFILRTFFSTDSAQCGGKPDASVLNYKMDNWPNTYRWVTCTLPEPYLWEARVLKRVGNDWVISVNEVYRRIPPSFRVNVAEDEALQIRIICPNGNVSPWSEIIFPGNFIQPEEPVLLNQGFVAKAKLSIAPNPNQGHFNISLSGEILSNEEEEAQVEVYSLAGQRVFTRKIPFVANGVFSLDLQGQGAGLYILKVQIGQQRFSEKLIISKY